MASVQNRIKIGEKILNQNVSMDESLNGSDGSLIDFKGTFPFGDSSTQQKSIFSIDREGDKLKVRIHISDIFKDKDGNLLTDLPGLKKEGTDLVFDIQPGKGSRSRPISFETRGKGKGKEEELIIKIRSTDGKNYTITSSATDIRIDLDDKSYYYSTENQNCIDLNMKYDVVENLLKTNDGGEYFQDYQSIKSVPPYLIGLYASKIRGNNSITLGKFTIHSMDFKDREDPNIQPHIFVTQPNSKGGQDILFFQNGSFVKCTGYLLQSSNEGPLVSLECGNNYYGFNLNTISKDETSTISESNTNFLKILKDCLGNPLTPDSTKDASTIKTNDGNDLTFYPKDARNYSDIIFKIKESSVTKPEQEKEDETKPPEPPTPEIITLIFNLFNSFTEFYNKQSIEIKNSLTEVYNQLTEIHNDVKNIYEENNNITNNLINISEKLTNFYETFNDYRVNHTENVEINNFGDQIVNICNVYVGIVPESQKPDENETNFYNLFIEFYQQITIFYQNQPEEIKIALKEIIDQLNELNTNINDIYKTFNRFTNNFKQIADKFDKFFKDFNEFCKNLPNNKELQILIEKLFVVNNIYHDKYFKNDKDKGDDENEKPVPPEEKKEEKKTEEEKKEEKKPEEEKKEEEKEEEEDSTEPVVNKSERNIKKGVEAAGNTLMSLGLFFLIGAMIPGVGAIFAILGAVMTGVGAVTSAMSEKFVWNPYEREKRKFESLEDYDTLEDDFFAKEKELDKLHELTAEKFKEVNNLVENNIENGGNAVAKEFSDLYNKYGVGFVVEDENSQNQQATSNFEKLQSMDGYSIREGVVQPDGSKTQGLIAQMKEINFEKDLEKRQLLIKNFIDTNFEQVPPQDRMRIAAMFDPRNQVQLNEFIEKMSIAHEAQGNERRLYREQKVYLSCSDKEIDEDRISRVLDYPNITPEQRKKIFERYGGTILKHYSVQDEISHRQITAILDKIPEEERVGIMEILEQHGTKIKSSIDSIKDIAKENVEKIDSVNEQETFAIAIRDLTADEKDYVLKTDEDYTKAVDDYLKDYTFGFYSNSSSAKQIEQLRDRDETAKATRQDRLSDKEKEVDDNLSGLLDEFFEEPKAKTGKSHAKNLAGALETFYAEAESYGVASKVGEMYKSGTDVSSILPPIDNVNNFNSNNTYVKVAKRLVEPIVISFEAKYSLHYDSRGNNVLRDKATNKEIDLSKNPQLKKEISEYRQAKKLYDAVLDVENQQIQTSNLTRKISDFEKSFEQLDPLLPRSSFNNPNSEAGKLLAKKVNYLAKMIYKGKPSDEQTKSLLPFARILVRIDRLEQDVKTNETDPIVKEKRLKFYDRIKRYVVANVNGTLNQAIIGNIHKYAAGRGGKEYSAEEFKKSRETVLTEVKNQKSFEDLLARFSPEQQKIFRKYVEDNKGKDKSSAELLKEIIIETLGNKKVEPNGPTYKEFLEQFCKENGNYASADTSEISEESERLIDCYNARSERELSSLHETLSLTRGKYGIPFVQAEYNQAKYDLRHPQEPSYSSVLELLVDRFGIDRERFISELELAQNKNPNITGSKFIESMLEKFGLDQKSYEESLKYVDEGKREFNARRDLTDKDSEALNIAEQKRKREEFKEKNDEFHRTWELAKNGDPTEFIKFCQDNNKFLQELNLPFKTTEINIGKSTVSKKEFEIVDFVKSTLADGSKKPEDIATAFDNYEQSFGFTMIANNKLAEFDQNIQYLTDLYNTTNSYEREFVEGTYHLADFVEKAKIFNGLWEKIVEDANNDGAKKEFRDFFEQNPEFIEELNLPYTITEIKDTDGNVVEKPVYEVLTFLDDLDSHYTEDEKVEKEKAIASFETTSNINSATDKAIKKQKRRLEYLEESSIAPSIDEQDTLLGEIDLESYDEDCKDLNLKINAILALSEKGYSDEDVERALTAFAEGDIEILKSFNIENESLVFSPQDQTLIDTIGADKKLIGNVDIYKDNQKAADFINKNMAKTGNKLKEILAAAETERDAKFTSEQVQEIIEALANKDSTTLNKYNITFNEKDFTKEDFKYFDILAKQHNKTLTKGIEEGAYDYKKAIDKEIANIKEASSYLLTLASSYGLSDSQAENVFKAFAAGDTDILQRSGIDLYNRENQDLYDLLQILYTEIRDVRKNNPNIRKTRTATQRMKDLAKLSRELIKQRNKIYGVKEENAESLKGKTKQATDKKLTRSALKDNLSILFGFVSKRKKKEIELAAQKEAEAEYSNENEAGSVEIEDEENLEEPNNDKDIE